MKDDFNSNVHHFFQGGFCERFWPGHEHPEQGEDTARKALHLLNATHGHILDWRLEARKRQIKRPHT